MIEVSRGILDIYKDETKIFNGPNLISRFSFTMDCY